MSIEKIKNFNYNLINYTIYGTIRGLVLEENEIKNLIENNKFDKIFVGISPEDLEGLKKYLNQPFEVNLSDYEIIYGLKLQKFGKVRMPIPSYTQALKLALQNNIEIIAIDMNEDDYAKTYTENVKFTDLLRHTFRKNRFLKKDFKANTPEEFAIKWDKEFNKIKGFKRLEEEREIFIANKIKSNKEGKNIFVIIDYERMEGVLNHLNEG